MTIAISGTTGITLDGQFNSASSMGFKNRIINGAMVIDQRNAGASVSISSVFTTYTLDRWASFNSVTGKLTVQQSSTVPTGFNNSANLTCSSAYTASSAESFHLTQYIEGYNVADLGWGTANAKTITLSFWVRSSLTGTFSGSLQNASNDRTYAFTYTISVADTWEYKTVTVAGDTTGTWLTTNGRGISLRFNTGSGSNFLTSPGSWGSGNYVGATGSVSLIGTLNATWYVTGVQLEKGSTATSFDYRPYGTELALCQRYLPAYTANASGEHIAVGQNISTTQGYAVFPLNVTPRVPPTGVTVSSAGHFYMMGATGGNNQCSALAFQNGSYVSASLLASVGSALQVAGYGLILQTYSASAKLLFTGCEL